jgi:hypothetical protein
MRMWSCGRNGLGVPLTDARPKASQSAQARTIATNETNLTAGTTVNGGVLMREGFRMSLGRPFSSEWAWIDRN